MVVLRGVSGKDGDGAPTWPGPCSCISRGGRVNGQEPSGPRAGRKGMSLEQSMDQRFHSIYT